LDQQGVERATATSYGNTITYTPEDAAGRAFDGDLETAWRAGAFGAAVGERIRVVLDDPITTDRVNLVQPLDGARDRSITEVALRFDDGDAVEAALDGSSQTATGQTVTFDQREFRTLEIEVTAVNTGERRLHGFSNAVGFAEVRVRDDATGNPVRVAEYVRMPADLLRATAEGSLDHPLVVIMSRDRVVPIPPRHDPEPAIARVFALPAGRSFSLTGTARATSEADAAALEALLRADTADANVLAAGASESLPGCVACGPRAAIDADTTAWQTPFDEVRGQYAEYELGTPVTFDHMDLAVVADGRHSVPTRVRLEVDGAVRELTLPAIADQAGENATTTVPLAFAPVTGRHVRLTILDVREASTFNFYSQASSLLPAAIAELGIPGVVAPPVASSLPPTCRTDLLQVDGVPVPVRVTGSTAAALAREPLHIEACDPDLPAATPTLELDRGEHRVEAAPGTRTGIQLDRIVLASAAGGTPLAVADGRVTGLPSTPPPAPAVEIVDDGRTRMRVHVEDADEPFWLVLGQSENAGWEASTDGATLGDRTLVDGFANGWHVDPTERSFDVVLEWTPQKRVAASLWLSVAGVIACLAIIGATWWRRRAALALVTAPDPADAETALEWPGTDDTPAVARRRRWLVAIAAALLGAVVAAPWIGILVGVVVALALQWRPARVFLAVAPAALLAFIGVYIAFAQVRYETPPVFEWPTLFPRARSLAWIALLLAVGAVAVDLTRRAAARRSVLRR
jgi:hypothetical protein